MKANILMNRENSRNSMVIFVGEPNVDLEAGLYSVSK